MTSHIFNVSKLDFPFCDEWTDEILFLYGVWKIYSNKKYKTPLMLPTLSPIDFRAFACKDFEMDLILLKEAENEANIEWKKK